MGKKQKATLTLDDDLILILAGILEVSHHLQDADSDIPKADARSQGERLVILAQEALIKIGATEQDIISAFSRINSLRDPSQAIGRLEIRILDYKAEQQPGRYHFNFEFHCSDCGGYMIHMPDNGHEEVTCTACGISFGTADGVRERCRDIAKQFMAENGL